jgi:anti-sigma B factor antagonist
MTFKKTISGNHATFAVEGRLDTKTSTELSDALLPFAEEGTHDITLDFTDLRFISSAGLRVLFSAHKKCKAKNRFFAVTGANDSIREIFEITGYTGI